MKILIFALTVAIAAPAAAQEPTPFRWHTNEEIPARISDGLLVGQMVAAVVADVRSEDRKSALLHRGCAVGLTIAVNEGLKRLINRERPNGKDRKSTPSMHTALAATTANWNPPIGASITVGVGWGRMASGWHFGSDVAFGAAIGIGAAQLCK